MKTNIDNSHRAASDELEFAYKIRRALDERITNMPEKTVNRLSAARAIAMERKKPEAAVYATAPVRRLAGAGGSFFGGSDNPLNHSINRLIRVGIAIPLLVLVIGAFTIYQYEKDRRINEMAELDAAVLTDELPLTAYLDHGFDTFLSKHGE